MTWHYLDGNDQRGPVTDADLDNLAQTGKIGNDTLVWREGMAEWQPYSQARGPIPGAPPTSSLRTAPAGYVVCAECGQYFPPDQVIRHGNANICAACKPVYLQKIREGVTAQGTLNYAGFWIRFVAYFLDVIILGIIGILTGMMMGAGFATPITSPIGAAKTGIGLIIGIAYYTFFVGKYGATPGKMATNLRVVNPDGSLVSYGKAFGRYFASNWVSGCFTLGIGYLMVAWDAEKRALHDRICSTRVIRK